MASFDQHDRPSKNKAIDQVLKMMGTYYAVPGRSGLRRLAPSAGGGGETITPLVDDIQDLLTNKDSPSPNLQV